MTSIAQRFRDSNVDLIISISTPALQAALNVTKDSQKPVIVFDSVTDPYSAAKDVIKSATDKPPHVTGIQAMPPVKDAMTLAQKAVPGAKRFGIIWTPAEANSAVATGLARDAAKDLGVGDRADRHQVGRGAAGGPESRHEERRSLLRFDRQHRGLALESLVKVATENKKPPSGTTLIQPPRRGRGPGHRYFDQGYDSGAMAARS